MIIKKKKFNAPQEEVSVIIENIRKL